MTTPGQEVQIAYDTWASTYDSDRNLTRDLDQWVTRQTLGDSQYRSILEIGCGTGKNTASLSQIGERVCAFDLSLGMIEQGKAKVSDDNIAFIRADLARPWPCAIHAADLVVCNLVLEHFPDLSFVFAEAGRALMQGGRFFICELHPFRQYQGAVAVFQRGQVVIEIPAYIHHISDFTDAAAQNGFALLDLREWWHEEDAGGLPRLASFLFQRSR